MSEKDLLCHYCRNPILKTDRYETIPSTTNEEIYRLHSVCVFIALQDLIADAHRQIEEEQNEEK